MDSKTQTEIVKVLSGFEDFKNLSQSQIKDAEDQIKKALDELGILTKQFEVLKKKFVQNEGKHSVDQASVSKEIKELSENFSGISKKIENFKQAASPILRKRSSMLGPKISINEDFTFSQAVESDYISPKYSELESEIKAHISRSTSEMQALKSELTSFFQKKIQPLEEKLQDSHKDYEKITGELQQKLSWLPINLSELNGMGPNDARLFTIEARLRAEENSRISALKTIEKSLEVISRKSPLHCKTPERRNAPNRGNSVDLLHRKTEYVEKRVESVDRRYKHTGGAEEGIYDSFEYRGKGNLRGHKSIDLNKELLLLGKVGNRKLFKK